VTGRKRYDQFAMNERERARRHDQATVSRLRKGREGGLDLAGVTKVERTHLHAD